MPPYFSGHLSSETYEIIAQSGEKRFFVHSDILTSQCDLLLGSHGEAYLDEKGRTPTEDKSSATSPLSRSFLTGFESEPFKNTVVGAGGESKERKINLLQWDGDTVGRFVEFLYVGHYQAPNPKKLAMTQESIISDDTYRRDIDTPETSVTQSDTTETAGSDGTESPVDPHRPLTPLCQFGEELETGRNAFLEREAEVLGLRFFNPSVCDYNDVLFAHAKVYALAQHLKVETLRKLSLQRLLSTLLSIGSIEPNSQVTTNIIDLLQYVYAHTKSSASEEPMRKIVSQFAALNFPALQHRGGISELVKEGGELASDLMDKVWKRLVNAEDSLQTTRAQLSRFEDVTDSYKFQRERASRLEEENKNLEKTSKEQSLLICDMTKFVEDAKTLLSIEQRARELAKKELNDLGAQNPSIWEAHIDRWGYRVSASDIFCCSILVLVLIFVLV